MFIFELTALIGKHTYLCWLKTQAYISVHLFVKLFVLFSTTKKVDIEKNV